MHPVMNVLHVIVGLAETIGGPPVALATLARAQAARGDDVFVLPARRTAGAQTLPAGAHGRLTVYDAPTEHHLLWYNAALKRELRRVARGCDIIHIHGTWRYHLLAAAGAARAYGIPYIVRPAGNLGVATRGHKAWRKRLYFTLFERKAINAAAAIHCCSRKEERELSGLGLSPRTFVVPQPVETDLTASEPDEASLRALCPTLRDEESVLLYVGRVGWVKRLDVLLEAFTSLATEFPEWRLVIAGTHEQPEIADSLRQRAAAANLSARVSLPGTVRGPQKAALLKRAAVFAQPSQHENFGLSVAEALIFGLPCVVSDGVAIGEDVAEAGAGAVCPSEPAAMAAALRPLMADRALREQRGNAAAALAQRFTPASVAAQLADEYARCSKT
ncbi:GDP-mannose:cellobiosyl-diphosphopolyprenol alpha-mannosyltransferase [Phycisphaerae bacterium RAS1]|nr:GDP-mannose:cellobiosyl-diphosphopolyprenol alpha-mannosyltransferase [Phycisphaerae bacterium RAS1]